MGYKRERRIYVMEFADPEYEGLEIRARSIPIRELTHLMGLNPESDDPEVRASAINELMAAFAEAIESWNMTDENDNPLPATLEYLESEDADFVMTCIAQWMKALTQVDDASPLDSNSQPGATAEVPNPLS